MVSPTTHAPVERRTARAGFAGDDGGGRRTRRPRILTLAAVLAAGVGCGRGPAAEIPVPESAVADRPPVVADAFRRLDRELPSETRDSLRAATPDQMWRYHFSIG